jgi:hypothetical protein
VKALIRIIDATTKNMIRKMVSIMAKSFLWALSRGDGNTGAGAGNPSQALATARKITPLALFLAQIPGRPR